MARLDPFTLRRITRFIEEFRKAQGVLPTLKDFEASGLDRAAIDQAEREGAVEKLYVTLTNGTIVKGYKVKA